MNPQDSRGHGGKPGLIEMGYSKDTCSTGSLARQRRPVGGEGRGGLLYTVSKFREVWTELFTESNACYDLQTLQSDHLLLTERSRGKAMVVRLPILSNSILIERQADDGLQNSQRNDELLLRRVAHDLVLQSPQDFYLLGIVPRASDLCYPGRSGHFREAVDGRRASK
jgi:hypothetical protein